MDLCVEFQRGWFSAFESIFSRGRAAAAVCLSVALSGCTFFPTSGPSPAELVGQVQNGSAPYLLVKLSPEVVGRVGQRPSGGLSSFSGRAATGPAPRIVLGVGDVVSVTIFEAAAGGLFIPETSGVRPGNFVTLPDQIVDNAGNITMPYAGTIKAAGRAIPDVQKEIVSRLNPRAIEPQVVITLKGQQASQVSVLGAVKGAARFPINPSGDRILDAIAKAGGPEYPTYETYVTLQRSGKQATEYMSRLINSPADNVYVRGGDIVILTRKPKTFVALGASGKNGQFEFGQEEVTLSEAIGRAGGLLDARAAATYVFLYREEDRDVLSRIGRNTTNFATDLIPTIYMVDLRDPSGYFLASKFDLQDKDVLFVANAASVDVDKVFLFIRSAAATGRNTDVIN